MEFLLTSRPIVVASHPRSGTHLTIDLLRRQFVECASWKWPGERNDRLYCNIDELNGGDGILSETTARRILERVPRPLVKTHAWVGLEEGFLPGHAGLRNAEWGSFLRAKSSWIYVWRDPRPVLCSFYLFCLGSGFVKPATSIGEFIRQRDIRERTRVEQWNEHVLQWTEEQSIIIINYDELIKRPEDVLQWLGGQLGLVPRFRKPLLPSPLPNLSASRKVRLFGFRPQSTAIINHSRLHWRDVFDENDLAYIDSIVGDTLEQLEASHDVYE